MSILRNAGLDSFNDLDLSGGKLNIVDDSEAVRVALYSNLKTRQGSYFLNLAYGLDYSVIHGKKGIDLETETEIKLSILGTQGVMELKEFDLSLDSDRSLTANFEAQTIFSTEQLSVSI
jgi:hypothetical protein